ncbi:HET-domain-containing protein [Podospora aff. communis PSN243]|uniref:HET-domain-containing protein n=1 Tax=Podospora aff. communis PSN243 TaxID=3040156 RepID=A0AAV9G728_9PEZI|nr:HET-domain-containing protein [Podospora aff. communis PSN243]
MRLFNAQALAFEEFYGDIPAYAILSHRWETEEVTFKDYTTQADPSNSSPMKGFQKIRYCIDQAKEDGLGYCWVDTCCIDQSSSAELSEAINSMYAWYGDSAVCYIYLADVSVAAPAWSLDVNDEERTMLHHQVAASQWFTRGWTLQELLAPRQRTFYNASWSAIMDLKKPGKGGLSLRLYEPLKNTTGISRDVLDEFSSTSRSWSIARKMSWASQRQTTRIEDTAYSLMGIFDINMPLLYGESKKAAEEAS